MDYKEFISNIFGSIKVSKESDNEFIIILPTKYRFADSSNRFKITINNNTVIISDRGNTINYLKDTFVDIEKYKNKILSICKINDIEFNNNVFSKEISIKNNMERHFFNFISIMYLIANISFLEEQETN